MKNHFLISTLAVALICAFSNSSLAARSFVIQEKANQPENKPSTAMAPAINAQPEAAANDKIRFTFQEQDWQDVIPWFAKQAGYSLQPIADWPDGTFTLKDDAEYTVIEALDKLNHALLIRPEPFTLIRNGRMLVLWKTQDANFPNDLIETVKVEELDQRGKYETISCIFDLGELSAVDMFEQLSPMIGDTHRNQFAVFPLANQIHVRETGGQLRDIRDLIKASHHRKFGDEIKMKVYHLQNQDGETFLMLLRTALGIPDGENQREDKGLSITVEPLSDRVFVTGTGKWLAEFDKAASIIDAPIEDATSELVLDAPYLNSYRVLVDPKLAFQVLGTMLEGRAGVKMDQDESTGAITVLGRAKDHELVLETLDSISNINSEDFAIITLTNGDPEEVIVVLQSMYRQTVEDISGPVLMANSQRRQILVRGTPQEVAAVKKMVANLDANSVPLAIGPRTRRRVIPMSEIERDELLPMLEDLLYERGRENPFNVVMPEDRKNIQSRIKTAPPAPISEPVETRQQPQQKLPPSLREVPSSRKTGKRNLILQQSTFLATSFLNLNQAIATGAVAIPQEEIGRASQEPLSTEQDSSYRPAPQRESIAGAPIEVRFTEYGIVLDSLDLDALDDLEDSIYGQLGAESQVQLPQFFPLNHRRADDMMSFLETYYGIAPSGGGGGAGGMVQGMMNNMVGGGTGDLLGGLLGGDSIGGSGESELEGDVRFGVDMPFNMVWVAGATGADLRGITALIETLDRPEAPHNPELIGEFRTIDIIHRDPIEVKELIEENMAELLDTGNQSEGGGQNNQQAQVANMIQQLSGRGGNGGAANREQEKPKARLGVDTKTNKLLVTGPKFIYEEVLKRVIELDRAALSTPPAVEFVDDIGNSEAYIVALQAMFGDKIELFDGAAETQTAQNDAEQTASESNDASEAQKDQQTAQRSALLRALQSRTGGGGRGGPGNSGAGRGGRGGGRGGQGGGRRGGGR